MQEPAFTGVPRRGGGMGYLMEMTAYKDILAIKLQESACLADS